MESATLKAGATSETTPELQAMRAYAAELSVLRQISHLLSWDEKTYMPPLGGAGRARQRALIAGIGHERATAPEFNRVIAAVEEQQPDSREARVLRRVYDLSTKLPNDFVREQMEAIGVAGPAWQRAREDDDFSVLAPHLERLVALARRQAEYTGYETEPYDALHDLYEEGMTAAELQPLFEGLRAPTQRLVDMQPEPDTSLLRRPYPVDVQRQFVRQIVASMGYDMRAGRVDPTTHPFCCTPGADDVRLTTRYDERWLPAGLFATIHEAGHGIYEQALFRLQVPAPLAEVPTFGMHESQSRMYENVVGRSLAFWEHHFPQLQQAFPEALVDATVEQFHRAVNVVERSFIRVEADEVTYNMHIALRFEIERALINGELEVRDLPDAWDAGMERWLGIRPTNQTDGCLQDVHWSMGSFGYFPTYTLGNVYAAQFVEAAQRDLGDLDAQLRQGDLTRLVAWFDEHVYRHGRAYTGREFVERITGGPIDVKPLVSYLDGKFGAIAS